MKEREKLKEGRKAKKSKKHNKNIETITISLRIAR